MTLLLCLRASVPADVCYVTVSSSGFDAGVAQCDADVAGTLAMPWDDVSYAEMDAALQSA